MSDIKNSIVSIWKGIPNTKEKTARGSGVCIAPRFVLTAFHVIESSQRNKPIKKKNIRIGSTSNTSGCIVKEIHRINDYDAVILELFQDHDKSNIESDYSTSIKNALKVQLLFCQVDQGNIRGPTEKQITNCYNDGKHWEFDTYPPEGSSGGAILYEEKLLGIILAQHKNNNCGLLLPLSLLENQIKAILKIDNGNTTPNQATKKPGHNTVQESSAYREKKYKELLEHLQDLKEQEKSEKLYEEISQEYLTKKNSDVEDLLKELLEKLEEDAASLIETLWICSEPYINGLQLELEKLLLLLLIQIKHKEKWLDESLHKLNVRTRLLSELIMASFYNIPPSLAKNSNNEIAGKFLVTEQLSYKECGIDSTDIAKEQAASVAKRLYKGFVKKELVPKGLFEESDVDEEGIEEDWIGINESIKALRKGQNPQFHRVEIDAKRTQGHPLLNTEVCEELYKLLPDLPVTHFGFKSVEGETRLRSQVSLFFDKLLEAN